MDKREFVRLREIHRAAYSRAQMKVLYKHPSPVIRWIEGSKIKEIIKQIENYRTKKNILDLGCEECYLFDKLDNNSFKVGIDFLYEPLRNLKRYNLIQADAHNLPFKDKSFDIVVCSETLEHVLYPENVLSEISRVCNGLVIVTIPNDNLVIKLKTIFRPLIGKLEPGQASEHLRTWDLKSFKSICQRFIKIQRIEMIPNRLLDIEFLISGYPIR
jgi:2-polyprenyl-3-methyl-5-hydroxy-6-metoxy-1,4-benzoquinol methylase